MHLRVVVLVGCFIVLALAGCISEEGESGDTPEAPGEPAAALVEAFATMLEPMDCPDIAVAAQMSRSDLQALLPAGFEAGDAHDFFLGLSPLAQFQQHDGASPMGALILFIQECKGDLSFGEGYTVIFVKPPENDHGLAQTGLNFVALQHAVGSDWLADASNRTGWGLDVNGEASVEQDLGPAERSATATWSNATGELASVTATGIPGHPPLTYQAVVRIWQPVGQGQVVYDHVASGNMYPGPQFSCSFADQSQIAQVTGQTDCSSAPGMSFSAFILEGHDPRIQVNFFPETATAS